MTTVQVPKASIPLIRRLLVHRRQPFYEVVLAALARVSGPVPTSSVRALIGSLGDEPP